jgi:hypothetical protein
MFQVYSLPKSISIAETKEPIIQYRNLSQEEAAVGVLSQLHEGMGWVMMHVMQFLQLKKPPRDIRGVVPGNLNPVERMFIYTNVIEPVDMNDSTTRLLRMVNTSGRAFTTTQVEFMFPIYLPVKKGKISRIVILISNDQGDPVPFQVGTVIITLHFRRREPRRGKEQRLTTAVYI